MLEVLINSVGPHERVRVQDPFFSLQRIGVDIRLHMYPFHLPSCIRPHSMIIWQRPLPESWERQLEMLRWFRNRGCLLLTEWDDHPDLFPKKVQMKLKDTQMAPIRGCHLLHTSSQKLALNLVNINPLHLILENASRVIKADPTFRASAGNLIQTDARTIDNLLGREPEPDKPESPKVSR